MLFCSFCQRFQLRRTLRSALVSSTNSLFRKAVNRQKGKSRWLVALRKLEIDRQAHNQQSGEQPFLADWNLCALYPMRTYRDISKNIYTYKLQKGKKVDALPALTRHITSGS
jgi:hypothetical protein